MCAGGGVGQPNKTAATFGAKDSMCVQARARDRFYEFVATSCSETWSVPFFIIVLDFLFFYFFFQTPHISV